MKKTNIWKRMTAWLRAFVILALCFLALGLGTLGSAASVGNGCALSYQQDDKGEYVGLVLNLSAPKDATYVDQNGETKNRDLYVKEVYFNLGAIYTEYGKSVTIRVARGTASDSHFYNYAEVAFANLFEETEEGKVSASKTDCIGNWVKYDVTSSSGWRVTTYPYMKISVTTPGASVLLNEIVFVANDEDLTAEGEHKPVVVNAKVYNAASGDGSVLPYGDDAEAVVDSQFLPNLSQSSFFRFGGDELYSVMTVGEIRQGKNYREGNVYHLDRVNNVLGIDLIALGAAVFGMSPFGLRFMPFLASFGVLVFGALFVRKLLSSDKAGFVFALLYALCGVSLSLGHFATPVMIGVFFLVASLYFVTKFFMDGMKEANFLSALPAVLGGLFAAAAICVNGAFVIPAAAVAGLFVAGLARQFRKTRKELDAAIDEVEKDEARADFVAPENAPTEPRKKLGKALKNHRVKNGLAGSMFFVFLLLGAYLITVLASLPMYFSYVKLYDNPVDPSKSVFYFLWKAFAGGFAGENYLVSAQSPWSFFYVLFKGTGTSFGVTAAGSLVAAAALLSGVIGAILSIVLLLRKMNDESFKKELVSTLILLVGTTVGLVAAAFAKAALAFLLLAYVFLFALGAKGAVVEDEGNLGKAVKVLSVVCLVALAACFGLFAVFTFSIPTTGFLSALWA